MNTIRRILDLLTPRERRQAYMIVPVVIAMALAQVAGIASLSPFLSLMANPDVARTNSILSWFYESFGFDDDRSFLIATGVVVLVALIVSNAILSGGTWILAYFGSMRNHSISRRLLISYLKQPYTFFLERNSAGLANNILQEVQQVINGIVNPGLIAIAETVSVLGILILLVTIDPWLALLTGTVLGGTYGLIYLGTRRYLGVIGRNRVGANQARHQAANEAMGGIKDVKLLGREAEMVSRYSVPSRRYARYYAANRIISTVPRYLLEAVAFGSIVMIVLVQLGMGRAVNDMIPVLGLYAFAGYRLLPALQRIFQGVANIRYSMGALDEVHATIRRLDVTTADSDAFADRSEVEALPFEKALALRKVTYRYPTSGQPVLREIDLEIPVRTSAAFVGATGAGKTTIVDIVLGLLTPDEGSLTVDGVAVDTSNAERWQKLVGYVPQSIFLTDDTVKQNIALGLPPEDIDDEAMRRAARMAQIDEFIENDLERGYETFVGERGVRLSGGQRQRLGIARALYHDPDVLVLDEATSALDGTTERSVFETIRALSGKKTILMIAHRLSTVQSCDQIFLLHRGRLEATGTYESLLASNPRFRTMAADTGDRRATEEPAPAAPRG